MDNEITQQLLDHIAAGGANYFNVIGDDRYYNSRIEEFKINGSIITICFVNGMLDIYDTDKIVKAQRPENRLNKCEYCYKIISKWKSLRLYFKGFRGELEMNFKLYKEYVNLCTSYGKEVTFKGLMLFKASLK